VLFGSSNNFVTIWIDIREFVPLPKLNEAFRQNIKESKSRAWRGSIVFRVLVTVSSSDAAIYPKFLDSNAQVERHDAVDSRLVRGYFQFRA